ncbi:hypothetical protein [Aeoliella mucimassa]|uniref:PEP-CTERM protein-sorting domain-containing protein n=1 Tax=Aeoliella mucimassa TaxID=2527972 RepID=A0A518AML8_9BACT|nr:hypothetical protein [Aeoliella mucimassa]QDU55972.1 hypothetical protein Pan181_21740 [Aeoliella mucimassa]
MAGMRLNLFLCVMVSCCALSPCWAQAPPKWGTQTFSSVGDIFAGGGQTNFTFDTAGGAGIPIAESLLDDSVTTDFAGRGPWDRAYARSFTGLPFTRNVIAPMRAEARLTGNRSNVAFAGELPAGAVAWSSAFVSDQFQYTGSQATTLSLTFELEGIVDDPVGTNGSIANALTNIHASAAVFEDTPNYEFFDGIGTLLSELGATVLSHNNAPAYDLDTLLIENDTAGAKAMRTTTIDFDVVPGQTFYVWQTLRAEAAYGTRVADAFSTLTAEFSQPDLVERVGFVVPEPSGLLLVMPLLVAMVLAYRRC